MPRSWLKPCSAKVMTVAEAAWLAGFMDGEGSVIRYKSGRNKQSVCWRLHIVNTNLASLEKCRDITGVGTITVKKKEQEHHRPKWFWMVHAQRDMVHVCKQIEPYCIIKGEKMREFLDQWVDLNEAA